MILQQSENNFAKFNEIYEKDRFMARVYAMEKSPSVSYVILNDVEPDVFQIFFDTHTYGVSKTLKRYYRKRTQKKIFVNKGRFFIMYGKALKVLTLQDVADADLKTFFIERYSWVRFLAEEGFRDLPFNSVVRHKLYSRNKVLRYIYKCAPDKALVVRESKVDKHTWKKMLPYSYNAENVNPELLQHPTTLQDACTLAHRLNEKVNLSWSYRRLKEEHDKWSKIYTKIVIEMDNEPLNVHQVYLDFNDFIGGGLLTQSGDLVKEGLTQQHCVASYKDEVNSGGCAIFHIDGYTAEIRFSGEKTLYTSQFKGLRNCVVPAEARIKLETNIKLFNASIAQKTYPVHHRLIPEQVDLNYPF